MAGRRLFCAEEVRKAKWIEQATAQALTDPSLAQACESLGAGERGDILLAKSLSANLVLMDESKPGASRR